MTIDPALLAKTKLRLRKATTDLRAAEHDLLASPPLFEYVLSHCQRAAERSLKAFLVWHGRPFRKTHNLEELGRQCVEIDANLQGIVDSVVPLTPYAWEYRRPTESGEPTREETKEGILLARRTLEAVLSYLPQDVRPQEVQPQEVQPENVQPQEVRPQEKPREARAADEPGGDHGAGGKPRTGVLCEAKPQFLLPGPRIHRHRERSGGTGKKGGQSSDVLLQSLRRPRRSQAMSYRAKQFWSWLSLTILLDLLQLFIMPPRLSSKAMESLASGMVAFGSLVALPMVLTAINMDQKRSALGKVVWSLLCLVGLSAIACLAGIPMVSAHMAR